MVADHQIGLHLREHPVDRVVEGAVEGLHHVRIHIAVARRLVGHLVGHAAHRKRQALGFEDHGEEAHAIREPVFLAGRDARDQRLLGAFLRKRPDGL